MVESRSFGGWSWQLTVNEGRSFLQPVMSRQLLRICHCSKKDLALLRHHAPPAAQAMKQYGELRHSGLRPDSRK